MESFSKPHVGLVSIDGHESCRHSTQCFYWTIFNRFICLRISFPRDIFLFLAFRRQMIHSDVGTRIDLIFPEGGSFSDISEIVIDGVALSRQMGYSPVRL
jgi:hypothetical protein